MSPQPALSCAQVLGVHPHWLGMPWPPQTSGDVQLPQSTALLHVSDTTPQLAPSCAQLLGAQPWVPHWLVPPPPQVCPEAHEPQSTTPPHPSGAVPQLAPS